MLESGYIKLYRSLLTWEWYQDANTLRLFLHLILTANHFERKWRGITVKRGQRVCSYADLSGELGLSLQGVRTAVKHLKSTGELTPVSYTHLDVYKRQPGRYFKFLGNCVWAFTLF